MKSYTSAQRMIFDRDMDKRFELINSNRAKQP
jgi:hypothetical protein